MELTCQVCGSDAPTEPVSLNRNIGLLLFRLHESTQGNLCRRCIEEIFQRYTLVNLTLGWWGVVSIFLTPVFLISNWLEYRRGRHLPLIPAGAGRVRLTVEEQERLRSLDTEVRTCFRQGDPPELVAIALSEKAGVTVAQATVYIYFEFANSRG
jgi:hypothetical protein